MTDHHVGELAYLDTFSGLVPCRVLGWVKEDPYFGDRDELQVKLTATRGAYRRGEVSQWPVGTVVPRSSVRVRSGQYRIRNDYAWVK